LVLRLMPHTTIGPHPAFDRFTAWAPGRHYADQVFQVAQECAPGLRLEDYATGPPIAAAAWQKALAFRARLPRGARVLALHPDCSTKLKSEKEWQPAGFALVLEAFLSRHPEYFAFVVGQCYDNLECGKHADRIISCLGLALDLTVGMVGTADLFLGVNSSMLHAADLFHVPSVGLFGPEEGGHGWRDWGVRFAPGRNISARRSVKDIEVGPVLEALDDLIPGGPSAIPSIQD
jgi:ADP-heptose:LPS heptosyltransferase